MYLLYTRPTHLIRIV